MKKEIKEGVNRKRNAGNTFVATQISISVISPSYIANNFIFFSFHNVSFVISATLLSCSVHNLYFRKRELKLLQLVLEIMRNSKDNWKKLQEKTFTP